MKYTLSPKPSRPRFTWTAAVLLLVLAAVFRIPNLGQLGFYGDEELTAFAARSMAEQGAPELPSGLAYRRALPFTAANSVAVRGLGAEDEGSYRVVSAVFGSVTPAALFVVAQPVVGPVPALLGGILLATSEWHVAFSRMARMYSPFLLFYVLAGCWLWRWSVTASRRYALLGWAAYAVGASLHVIGVFATGFALLPLAMGIAAVPAGVLIGTTIAGATGAWLYDRLVVLSAYKSLEPPPPFPGTEMALEASAPTLPVPWVVGIFLGGLGLALGSALWRPKKSVDPEAVSLHPKLGNVFSVMAGVGALLLAGAGFVGAAATALFCWLALQTRGAMDAVRAHWKWIAVGVVASAVWAYLRVDALGVVAGAKELIRFPYPYTLTLGAQLPFMFGLAVVPIVGALARPADERNAPPLGFGVVVVLSLAGIGVMTAWGPSRYLFHLYPFVLLLAGVGLAMSVTWLGEKLNLPTAAPAVGAIVALSGVLGTHGIPDATRALRLDYGQDLDRRIHMFATRPDHKGAGEFVRENLRDGDVVIAEDVQQQAWYVGRVDYMLRSETDIWPFLFTGAGDTVREEYIGAELLWSHADFDRLFAQDPNRRVWVITSGETWDDHDHFLNSDQRGLLRWLDDTGAEVFEGRDGVTRVYCVGCDRSAD